MKSFAIGKANFALLEQFIVEANLTYYDRIKVVRITQSDDNTSEYKVEFHSDEDSQYTETVTVDTLDLISYIALKSGVINVSDKKD